MKPQADDRVLTVADDGSKGMMADDVFTIL
jgi:hypothetical protein